MISIRTSIILIFSLTLSVLVSCKKDDTKTLPSDILSLWKFEGYKSNSILEEIPDSISIDLYIGSVYSNGNDFEGESPYRNYWGRFRLDGENIEFYDLRVTDILTPDDSTRYHEIEKKYLLSLIKSDKYSVENNVLTLFFNKDSCLVFKKSENTFYDEEYGLSALYNGQKCNSGSNDVEASLLGNYSGLYYYKISGELGPENATGMLYNLGFMIYYPPQTGDYYETTTTSIHAYSSAKVDPGTTRFESSAGYVRISRVSRRFVSGEFEFHMLPNGNQANEFDITKGKFKARLTNSYGFNWYTKY